MAALAVDLDGISLRSLAKRVRGKWYTLSKSRVAEGTVDIRKVASDRNPRAGHHEVGRLLAEYSPVVIDMTGLPETDSALGQDSMADPSEATVTAPTAYVHESTNWRVIGKVDDDGYVSESANWRTVGKVDRSGYVSESANWRTIGKVEDDGYISESTNWRVVGKVDTSGYVTESTNWRTVGKVDATSPRLAGGAALLLLLSPI